MDVTIPARFEEIVAEISRFTGLPAAEVEARVWREALEGGWNVGRDVARFGATPHRYDARLARVYEEGEGFIFETLVFWARPLRQRWIAAAVERLESYAARRATAAADLRILMLGDGCGNDSLYLAARGYRVDYCDTPRSRTAEFAHRRFAAAGLLDTAVRPVADYGAIGAGGYDAVVSFEVLEHLPDPRAAIADVARFLRPGGIALVTEAFDNVRPQTPTHLAANSRFDGRTPFLFRVHGLALSWYNPEPRFKPFEFTNTGTRDARALAALITDEAIVRAYLLGRYRNGARRAWALVHRMLA
jgi:SAM-dependent methyltransferase